MSAGAGSLPRQKLLARILDAHRACFDVEEHHEYAGRVFAGYAEYHAHGESFVLVKRAKLWEADMHQYVFFEAMEHLDAAGLEDLVAFMKTAALGKVEPKQNHMSSDIGLVLVADSISDAAAAQLKRTRFRKNYLWGLQGWSDLKLAAVDMHAQRVVSNGAGKDMREVLERALRMDAEAGRAMMAEGECA